MTRISNRLLVASLVAVSIAGCSPNKLSERKVYEIISPRVEKLPCTPIFIANFDGTHESFKQTPEEVYPIQMIDNTSIDPETGEQVYNGGLMVQDLRYTALRNFVKSGLMDVSSEFYDGSEDGGRPYFINKFQPSPSYLEYFSSDKIKDGVFQPVFCLGKGVVTELISFTIPNSSESNSSIVKFNWASSAPENLVAMSSSLGLYNKPKTGGSETVMLVLTNNGWELASSP